MIARARFSFFLFIFYHHFVHWNSYFILYISFLHTPCWRSIQRILKYPPTRTLSGDERQLLWKFRFSLMSEKRALTKFLRCVEWSDVQVSPFFFSQLFMDSITEALKTYFHSLLVFPSQLLLCISFIILLAHLYI